MVEEQQECSFESEGALAASVALGSSPALRSASGEDGIDFGIDALGSRVSGTKPVVGQDQAAAMADQEGAQEENSAQDMAACPLCCGPSQLYREVDGVAYHACAECDFIFAHPQLLERVDQGLVVREYGAEYWATELASARQRSYGSSLARLAEALLYCTIPVERFIDIGTGPGYLLDAVERYLPHSASRFYGVEKFPPLPEYQTRSANYLCADLADVELDFQCGICVEVLEHLTPSMARGIAAAMAKVSVPGSLYLFNTGLTDYVRHEDPGYLDPYLRGHITCWSVTAARRVFEPQGFEVRALPGKSWAFVVEMPGDSPRMALSLVDRIWSPEPGNIEMLSSAEGAM